MASVPDIVMTPAAVTGPPAKANPVTVLDTSILVTVPAPVIVNHDGAALPFDTNT